MLPIEIIFLPLKSFLNQEVKKKKQNINWMLYE